EPVGVVRQEAGGAARQAKPLERDARRRDAQRETPGGRGEHGRSGGLRGAHREPRQVDALAAGVGAGRDHDLVPRLRGGQGGGQVGEAGRAHHQRRGLRDGRGGQDGGPQEEGQRRDRLEHGASPAPKRRPGQILFANPPWPQEGAGTISLSFPPSSTVGEARVSGTEDARSEAWTDLPSGIVLHGALSLPGRVRVLARTEPVAETTLPPAEAERLARALADAGYEVSLETRLHPRRDAARATILRLSERLAVPVDPARLEVAGDFEMAPGASLRADVTCASARLHAGCALEGDVQALHDVEVGEGARVRGRVACGRALHVQARARVERGAEARTLRLEPGALVQGRIRARDSVAT